MTRLPSKLAPVVERLLAKSAASRKITLDEVGEAIGVVPVSTDDVDALLGALERAGREVIGPQGARGVTNLQRVIPAARILAGSLGRPATLAEIATHTGLSEEDVRHALALGRVMGR
jgi:sigma-70-like protein